MPHVSERLLETISSIYEVGLAPSRWPQVLDRIAKQLNAIGATLSYEDPEHPELSFGATCVSSFWCDGVWQKYLDALAPDEPFANLLRPLSVGQIVTTESISDDEKRRIEPYLAKARSAFGLHGFAGARLSNASAWFDYMLLQYDGIHGPISVPEHDEFRLLLPHVMKAMEIARPMALLEQRYGTALDVLDRLHIGVIVLSGRGLMVCKNRAAAAILEQDDGLSVNANGELMSKLSSSQATLAQAISESIDMAKARCLSFKKMVSVPRRSGNDPFLVEVAPVHHQYVSNDAHGVLIYLIDPCDTARFSTRGIKALYSLTDAESEICRLLVDGLSNREVAERRGVSPETVKTHVQSVLSKTGALNRAGLVRLAVSVNLPVDVLDCGGGLASKE